MKYIVILGEEYWFQKEGFSEASFLINYLEENINKKLYTLVLIKTPKDLIPTIEKFNVSALLLFQDVISDAYLNRKNIKEMKDYLRGLQNKGIHIYPPIDIIDIFASKKYNLTLKEQLPWAQLPFTDVYYIDDYHPKLENKIISNLYEKTTKLWEQFKKVVIKKGYSYEGKQVKVFNKETLTTFELFRSKAKTLNYKNFWGVGSNSINIDRGSTRYYIIQPFNKIVSKRINEYRVFFHCGKARYIAKGDDIPNKCVKDMSPLEKEIIDFSKKLYKKYIPLFWTLKTPPILFRIDVSFADDPLFQDKFSVKVNDKLIRLYANEIEIDPTSFFYNSFVCEKDKKFDSKTMQIDMAKCIVSYINKYIQ